MDPLLLAHGLGGRTDLPLDPVGAIIGGGVAVAASFWALTAAWRRPRLRPDAGRPVPPALETVARSPAVTAAGRAAALAALTLVIAAAFLGPDDERRNLAPWALYVTFWVGLVPLSALAGPVWRRINPLRTLHAACCRLARLDPAGRRPAPDGLWPAAVGLTAFVWLELVAPHRADPRLVGALICGYAAVHVAAALHFGREWFARADAFEVYAAVLARMAPIGRRPDGRLVWRTPLTGLTSRPDDPPQPGLTAVACVLIGSTAFDGITRTTYWRDAVDPDDIIAGTLGLAAAIALVAALYLGALRLTAALTGLPAASLPGRFAPTLLPIALGYTLAHYFSFLLLEGQMTVILASDPFGLGWDLLGTAGNRIDYDLASPTLVAQVQVNAIVLGHIAATVAAHDLALRLGPPDRAVRGQLPVAAVMVALTCAGLFALLSG
ncbi:hypothetical protein [Thermomonospora catenispora]|uniref:hypothetical protein n=1 Tax=Thermomonospora catenispora TaxID=2493090 RepID=UPI00111E530E|nr:hypothetical protein [Thermomonospora catenispora]TNY34782.1 hypothetical protein EIO00_21880 [Thermomonospora catenispora]